MFCPKCGTQNADGARFCLKCGTSLVPDEAKAEPKPAEGKPVSETPASESKWPKIFWIIAAAGAAIGLLSSIILFFTNLINYWRLYSFGSGISTAFKSVFSANRIFTGLFLIAAVVVFFIPITKKYPYIVAIPRAILGLIAFIDSISGLIADIRLTAAGYLYKPGLAIVIDVLWILAGILFCLAGIASLLAIIFREKLKGKEKLAVIVLGGASVLVILIGLLASLLEIIYGITLSFASTLVMLSGVLFHAALLGAMCAVLYVNLKLFGMEIKDLKNVFKKEEIKEEVTEG